MVEKCTPCPLTSCSTGRLMAHTNMKDLPPLLSVACADMEFLKTAPTKGTSACGESAADGDLQMLLPTDSLEGGDFLNEKFQDDINNCARTMSKATEDESDDDSFDLVPTTKGIDKFLFIWHSFLMMLCLFLVLTGVLLRFQFTSIVLNNVKSHPAFKQFERFVNFQVAPKELLFGELTQTLGNALIVLNSVHILCTMMYMSFQVHQNQFTLPVGCLVSGVIILMEVTVTNIYMDETSSSIVAAKKELQQKLTEIYQVEDSTVFSVTYDILALWGRCCGITEKYNFEKNTHLKFSVKTDKERSEIQYPPTCCNESLFMLNHGAFDAVKECALTGEGTYSQGCYYVLYNWLNNYCSFYAVATVLQLLDMWIHIAVYSKLIQLFQRFATVHIPLPKVGQ